MKRVPELRFKEFDGEWEEKRYSEIFKINQGLQIPISERFTDYKEGRYFYITNEFLKKNSQLSYYIENPPKTVMCEEEDILMTRTGNTGKVVTNVKGVFHNNFFKIKYNNKFMTKQFIYYLLTSTKVQNKLLSLAGNSTIPDLNHSEFYKMTSDFPLFQEQKKISDFLSIIDNKISLIEEKLQNLKNYKKGIIQKIFSQEIRFKDKNSVVYPKWEKKKLDEISECMDNRRKPLNSVQRIEKCGKIPYYGANGIVDYVEDYIFDEDIVLLAEDGGNFDDFINKPIAQFVTGKSWVNNHAHVLKNKDNIEIKFLFYSLVHKDIRNFINGTSRSKLNKSSLLNISIDLPTLKEQQKIATFLTSIDDKILIVEKSLKELKTYKKGLLQKMFI